MNRRDLLKWSCLAGAQTLAGCVYNECTPAAHSTLDAATFNSMRRFARVAQGDVAYVAHGAGPAAVFLHGFPLNGFQWRDAIVRLAPYRRCIAPDFLGMGWSGAAADQDVGPEAQVEMLISLFAVLGIDRADVIANDSGIGVAQLLAVRHPERVRTLLLTNGDTEIESPPAAMRPVIELAKSGRFVDEWLLPWLADPARARSDQGIGGMCYANRAHPTDEALMQYFGPLTQSDRKRSLHRYCMALERNALAGTREALRRSRIPVRIVWGMGDGIFNAASATFLDEAFGASRGVRRLEGAKLFWPEEKPDIIAGQARLLWAHG
jgi:haloalkane dehalogenase